MFWRKLHGLFVCDASKDADRPALVMFVGGPLALDWRALGEAGMRAEAATRLAAALGPEALRFIDLTMRDWSHDRWSGGGYGDLIVDMEAHDAEDVLRAGTANLHFAFSELSPSFPGYIEGAIVAGRAAARKVIAELAKDFG